MTTDTREQRILAVKNILNANYSDLRGMVPVRACAAMIVDSVMAGGDDDVAQECARIVKMKDAA